MTPALRLFLVVAVCSAAVLATQAMTQTGDAPAPADAAVFAARQDMETARREGEAARQRAVKLEGQARAVTEQAEKTAREAAAIAARIQEAEAAIAAQQARIKVIAAERAGLRSQLAEKQGPLARLTGALQRLSRRPPLLALLRPGSVRDAVYMRALLDTMMPEVERRTVSLRQEISKGRSLEVRALQAETALRADEAEMRKRRKQLASLEARQRLDGRRVSGLAARESDRALSLAEKARDLGDLVEVMGEQARLREALAQLPGPVMRPADPQAARSLDVDSFVPPPTGLPTWILPVTGRIVTGFGEEAPGQARAKGVTLATRGNAQVVSPAPGRIAFAGRYRGYGDIVIIEHDGGWTSLVTGLARLGTEVGDNVVAGSPLGMTGPGEGKVMVELRRSGESVNPLQYIRSL